MLKMICHFMNISQDVVEMIIFISGVDTSIVYWTKYPHFHESSLTNWFDCAKLLKKREITSYY